MKGLLILAGIGCIIIIIIIKQLNGGEKQRSQCQSCGKFYGGKPARCPHCGESLRWKQQ